MKKSGKKDGLMLGIFIAILPIATFGHGPTTERHLSDC
jgi:hypothetical protein